MLAVRFPGKTDLGRETETAEDLGRETESVKDRSGGNQEDLITHISFKNWWPPSLYIIRPLHCLMPKAMLEMKWELTGI